MVPMYGGMRVRGYEGTRVYGSDVRGFIRGTYIILFLDLF